MNIFRKTKPGSAELRSALGEIDIAKLESEVQAAESERRELLVDGSDDAVREIESRLSAARLAVDRAVVRRSELEKPMAEPQQREFDEALERDRAAVAKEAEALRKTLRQRYISAVRPLVELLTELEAVEEKVYDLNHRLGEAGWLEKGVEQIPGVEIKVFRHGLGGSTESVLRNTILKNFRLENGYPDPAILTWPPAARRI